MFRSLLSAGLLAIALHGGAQTRVHQVMVLNEGYFDFFGGGGQLVPVTLGSYDPVTGAYLCVDTLHGPRFGSHVIVDGTSVYVAADDRVVRYDADSHQRLGEVEVPGVRKLAVWNDLLLLTRGELGGLPHYFEARDKNSLVLLHAIGPAEGLVYSAEDILVTGGKAHLAVNNAFDWADLQGRIGTVDLATMVYESEVDLGPEGLNPEKLMLHEGAIYAFNNKDFSGSSISKVALGANAPEYTVGVAANSSCASSAMAEGNIYYMEYAQNELARFDVATARVLDTLAGSPAVYGLLHDPVNRVFYATTTDFFSTGELLTMDLDGRVLGTVAVGVAPGNLALDIRTSTSIGGRVAGTIGLFPNPAVDAITITGLAGTGNVALVVTDAMGRAVHSEVRASATNLRMDVAALPKGIYLLRADDGAALRFVKH